MDLLLLLFFFFFLLFFLGPCQFVNASTITTESKEFSTGEYRNKGHWIRKCSDLGKTLEWWLFIDSRIKRICAVEDGASHVDCVCRTEVVVYCVVV